ncbi:hypothetical protein GH5_05412 [Leishmania sp. Ghana 2012 LV757]|uniref:hypothetical protein n=1 Tax=Leishmania sp. Ghana 2012 LV757 TaxID=2803181 RepID=UPI001B419EA1|nr:hypothetical protein GH5_05412 [Leishmania sp. Ghana 2012 LV757]
MLRRLLERCTSSSPTPQDAFKRAHAHLACPPLPSTSSTSSSATATPQLHIVDPYHFVICQHGVLGGAADFENVILDAFVNHEVSVLEATEMATEPQPQAQYDQQAASMRDIPRCANGASALHETAPISNADDALTAEQQARRAAYKTAYRLQAEYPNRMKGRLYRSGNLQCFSPGSNEYLRTDAGTQVCARRMLTEVVPALHAWLNEVISKEKQRRAKWAVYAQLMGVSDASSFLAEAAAPLPVCLSLMAHSFGGIIQRELIYLLLVDQTETRANDAVLFDAIFTLRHRLRTLHVTFENFVTVATPHCGAGECLWWPMYCGAWCLARLNLCQTYDELILSDANCVLQRRLLDGPHQRVLQLFRRRVLFSNTHRDILVGFGTCSLIFENVDTDHTKFIGVAPRDAHCAAAFVKESAEVSKPILLRSFQELRGGEAQGSSGSVGRCDFEKAAPTRARTYTMDDLIPTSEPSSTAATAATKEHQTMYSSIYAGTAVSVGEGCFNDSNFRTASWRPQATSSSVSGLTASSGSMLSPWTQSPVSNSTAVTRMHQSSFAALLTIGSTGPAYGKEVVHLEAIAVLRANPIDNIDSEIDNASESSASAPSTAGSVLSRPLAILGRQSSSILSSPLLSPFIRGSGGGAPTSHFRDCDDRDSVTSSRCTRNSSVVTSLLRDPRWASEHVRSVASTLHTAVRNRVQTSPTSPKTGESPAFGQSNMDRAMAVGNVAEFSECTSLVGLAPPPAALLMPGAGANVPQYRRAPRTIAATLRQKMSWRVRAIRLNNILPAGHVACLGNWSFFGRSPSVVQAVAEEMLIIL